MFDGPWRQRSLAYRAPPPLHPRGRTYITHTVRCLPLALRRSPLPRLAFTATRSVPLGPRHRHFTGRCVLVVDRFGRLRTRCLSSAAHEHPISDLRHLYPHSVRIALAPLLSVCVGLHVCCFAISIVAFHVVLWLPVTFTARGSPLPRTCALLLPLPASITRVAVCWFMHAAARRSISHHCIRFSARHIYRTHYLSSFLYG